jgi:aconitate hydratase
MSIFDAAERYRREGVPLVVVAGRDYGAGSSRDWAAKGTRLLGVRAVIARGFERIHRANLVGMGVLPCQLPDGVSAESLGLDGSERYALRLDGAPRPRQPAALAIERADGRRDEVPLVVRLDTPIEAAYFAAGGILRYVVDQLLGEAAAEPAP